jgi:transglutaminase-like putative cysteine protease
MSAARSPALKLGDVLWLIASMAFVIAPHLERQPLWVAAFCGVILAWRAAISWRAWRAPPRWLISLLAIAVAAATWLTYRRLMGRDPGVTFLLLLVALKVLEMRTQREVTLAIFLGFFLVMTNFLYSQSIPLGLYMLACVWIFIATWVGFSRVGSEASLRERLYPAGAMLLQALPMMLVFFVLFPRVQGPLWAIPQDGRAGRSGLSDSMTPGNISNLIKSEETAFRVIFDGDMPNYQSLYFRGPVMPLFDGRTWRMSDFTAFGKPVYTSASRASRYTVILEASGKPWLFALDVPGMLPKLESPELSERDRETLMLSDLQLRARRPLESRVRYEMTSLLDYRYGETLTAQMREFYTRIEGEANPRTRALGRQWAAETPDKRQLIDRAFSLFNTQFTYTLEPPLLGENPYDEFLFKTKLGFCEHYAGSFALLMRAAGIPARVVTGYQGGEINPLTRELVVRQADAHAWTEVWLEGLGWFRADPTAAVSPLRVDNGINAALGPIGMFSTLAAADKFGLLSNLRFAWDMMNSSWTQWVLGYNVERQRQFLAGLGLGVDWKSLGLWLVGLTLLVGGAVSGWLVLRDRPRHRDPAQRAWLRFCAKLARIGLKRQAHEGPLDFLARVRAASPQLADQAAGITHRYVELRYGSDRDPRASRDLLRLVRQFPS